MSDVVIEEPIAAHPLALFRWAQDSRLVYSGGRGLGRDGAFYANRFASRWHSSGGRGFHCTSWTNFVLAYFTGVAPEDFTEKGNMPSLFWLCEKSGTQMFNPLDHLGRRLLQRPVPIHCYGQDVERLFKSGSIDDLMAAIKPGELVVAGESSLIKGSWRWWHHTSAWYRDHDGTLYRMAADGYKSRTTGYSHDPMRVQRVDDLLVRKARRTKQYRAYRVNWQPGNSPLRLAP